MTKTRIGLLTLALLWTLAASARAQAAEQAFILASTTSTEQSGLYGFILPRFTAKTGITVRVLALGTGQALDAAKRGDADLLLVHDPVAEAKFVADGYASRRTPVMYNDFVLVCPASNPAKVESGESIANAMKRVAATQSTFVSRGDRSATHAAELRIWEAAGVSADVLRGAWYRSSGQGMGPALNIASASDAYILTDRSTWAAYRNKSTLRICSEGDPVLRNQYSVLHLNALRYPSAAHALASAFADWLVSAEGQRTIAEFRIGGEQQFWPNAQPGISR